jgi:dynein heavy chain
MVVSLCRQLEKLLSHEHIFKCLEYVFTYAVVWAVGGVLCEKDGVDYRKEFSTWWKSE